MRVTHVITRLIVGGAQENTIATVLGLRQRPDVAVHLIAGPTSGPEGTLEPAVSQVPGLLTVIPELIRSVHPWQDWRAAGRLVQLFHQQRPDIVHTHSGKAGILGRWAAHRAGVQVIVHTIHGPSFGPFQGALANALFRAAERAAAAWTTQFVAVANAMSRQYLAAGIGVPERYTRIFSGFDLEPFLAAKNDPALRARYGIQPGDLVVGKIARLFKLKGHEDLFRAAPELVARCPEIKFLLVGDGAWRQRFEARARALGLEKRFIFTGLVAPSAVPGLIGLMDLLVHLSTREGLARALPQALAAGKPVVSYDCDGAGEVCLDQQTGFLISPGDRATLVRRVEQLARSPALREELGGRGRAMVMDCFSERKMVQAVEALYRRLLGQAQRKS